MIVAYGVLFIGFVLFIVGSIAMKNQIIETNVGDFKPPLFGFFIVLCSAQYIWG